MQTEKSWERTRIDIPLEKETELVEIYRGIFITPNNLILDNSDLSLLRWKHLQEFDEKTNWPKTRRAIYSKKEDKLYSITELLRI